MSQNVQANSSPEHHARRRESPGRLLEGVKTDVPGRAVHGEEGPATTHATS